MSIEHRLTKLEQIARDRHVTTRLPGISEEVLKDIRRVAAACNSPAELEAYLQSLQPRAEDRVVSLEEKRRTDAVMAGLARTMFEEARE